uniref:Predicted protein n=1 Tax=Hordeum vulgare subsp. vulgare TaxID=112509 RepID=F2E883_HORVV|nr:predicted protein [Hordeum vulgare subsp. vulgare]
MRVLFALLALTLWFVSCSAIDSFTSNATSYNVGDQMVLTLVTANVYSQIDIIVNNPSIVFASITDSSNGFTGTLTFTGTVTCRMAATASSNQLNITATVVLFPSGTPSTLTPIAVTVVSPPGACNVYFTVPATDPAQIDAGQSFPVTIQTTIALNEAYITLNGQFFCNIGPVGASATGSCTGFVPCFLPSCAEFAIVGQVTGSAAVTYPGPTVQLIPNPECVPAFGLQQEPSPACLAQFTVLSTVDFTFQINPNDNIDEYSNFEIWANTATTGFPTSFFVARVAGPLCTLVSGQFTYLIARWVIPCELNAVGSLTFTLSYTQTLDGHEKFLRFLTITNGGAGFTIVPNNACNLSLILNYSGSCPLPYVQSDCGCLAEGSGSSLAPCGNCPACPSLAVQSSDPIVPGSVLNFYVHDGSIAAQSNSFGIISNTNYYSHNGLFVYAATSTDFYVAFGATAPNNIGFKPLPTLGNTLTSSTTPILGFFSISAFPFLGVDQIWAIGVDLNLYCGIQASVVIPITIPSNIVVIISVGPQGAWAATSLNLMFHAPSIDCASTPVFTQVLTAQIPVLKLSSSLNGAYYYTGTNLYFIDSTLTSTLVPGGGPSLIGILSISGSNTDNSLAVVDSVGNVWTFNSVTNVWTKTSLTGKLAVVNLDINHLYVEQTAALGLSQVNYVQFGFIPLFPSIPLYTNLSLTISSALPNLVIYSSPTDPTFDSCNNALVASWTVPASYKGIGAVTATLNYTATFASGASEQLSSSVSFSVGPSPINPLQPRDFCPLPCSPLAVIPSQKKVGCSSCQ